MRKPPDILEFLKLAARAGTQFYGCILAVVLLVQLITGRFWFSWLEAVAAYPICVALFVIGPALMWLFFRLLILVSSWALHRKHST